jgi:hypothetical protein
MRAWMVIVSMLLGATAGWAAYFAWAYRNVIGGQELAAGVLGAIAGLIVWSILAGGRGQSG